MNHPFGPLLLVGLIEAESPAALRDRRHRREFLESRRSPHRSIAQRLRAVTGSRGFADSELACCPA